MISAAVAMQPFGQARPIFPGHAEICLAGIATRVAWRGRPARNAAMALVGTGESLVITATEQIGNI